MNPVKIDVFDRYIMRGGDQSLQNIEDLCDFGFNMLQQPFEPELFDDVVIDVIRKLTKDLDKWNTTLPMKSDLAMLSLWPIKMVTKQSI